MVSVGAAAWSPDGTLLATGSFDGVARIWSAELAVLHEAFAGAERGTGKAIGISAPPGLGKSRLCFEFTRVAKDRLVPVLDLRASPYDHSGPLQPLVEFFRTFFRLASTDDPETARSKIASRIEATVPELIDDVSILADFLGIRDTNSPTLVLDPKTRHARLINLVSSLVRDGTRTPSVIIIEDIHWLDVASVEFVSALVDIISVSRVLLILTYRPTFQVPWNEGPGFHRAGVGRKVVSSRGPAQTRRCRARLLSRQQHARVKPPTLRRAR